MKPLVITLSLIFTIIVIGCNTTQQGKTLNSLSTLEQATTAAYDSYITLVVKGSVGTNDVPTVSKAFNDFQAAMVLATVAVQANTNALAPQNLIDESVAVINLISTIEGKK